MVDGTIRLEYTARGQTKHHIFSLVSANAIPDMLRKRKQDRLLEITACVECGAAVRQLDDGSAASLACTRCPAVFPGDGGRFSFLTDELRSACGITTTDRVSTSPHDAPTLELIARYPEGLILDCGAGNRSTWYPNVVNLEIAPYPSTEVLGVNERLPFRDESFDAVLSLAVLEHVANPFQSAREIGRVLKKGGVLYASAPLLQPVHGYPHHYFNMTAQGLTQLFSEHIERHEQYVLPSGHPVWTLNWLVQAWANGLQGQTRERFLDTPLRDFLTDPAELLGNSMVSELDQKVCFEIASMTTLLALKRT